MSGPAQLVALLKAAGEITRLRLLALLAEGELSVKDFTEILGQSQPRVSRHLKLLADVGLVVRHAEGAWAYYRLAEDGSGAAMARWLVEMTDPKAAEIRHDRERLESVRAQHRAYANAYFAQVAEVWDRERSLHVPEAAVEAAVVDWAAERAVGTFLDLGTGTGRMLELLGAHFERGIGIDSSREMLAVARAKLGGAQNGHAQVRLGDVADLASYTASADLVMFHQVLHYFEDPGLAIAEASRCLRPGGGMMIVDFAPHTLEFLRSEHAHLRLGLSDEQMGQWARAANMTLSGVKKFPHDEGEGLTVCLWLLETANQEDKEKR